jgi:hypothetical protein
VNISTTVAAINRAIGTFNTKVATDTAGAAYPPPAMPTLSVDPHGYKLQDLWGTNSVVSGGSLARTISSAGSISARVPPEGVALYRVTPLSGATITAPSIRRVPRQPFITVPPSGQDLDLWLPDACPYRDETGALPTACSSPITATARQPFGEHPRREARRGDL